MHAPMRATLLPRFRSIKETSAASTCICIVLGFPSSLDNVIQLVVVELTTLNDCTTIEKMPEGSGIDLVHDFSPLGPCYSFSPFTFLK